MTGEDGHPHADPGDQQLGDAEDLARLEAQLLLLVGLAETVVDDRPREREHVVGDGAGILHRLGERDRLAVVGQLARLVARRRDLGGELLDAGDTGAGDGLVRRRDQPDQPGLVVQRLEHRHRGHGRAVGVGDDALGRVGDRLGVDLGDDQRDVGVAPPGRGVVDDGHASRGEHRRQRA